jgi:hypothetical protein
VDDLSELYSEEKNNLGCTTLIDILQRLVSTERREKKETSVTKKGGKC